MTDVAIDLDKLNEAIESLGALSHAATLIGLDNLSVQLDEILTLLEDSVQALAETDGDDDQG